MRIGFARDIVVEAKQARGPLPERHLIAGHTIMDVPPEVYDDLVRAHPGQVFRLDALGWIVRLGMWDPKDPTVPGMHLLSQPQRATMMRVIDCPRCYPPKPTPAFTRCRICEGATKVYTL